MKRYHAKHLIVLVAWCLFTLPRALPAQEIQIPIFTSVGWKVQKISLAAGIFTYRYALQNPPTNTAELGILNLDISQPEGGIALGSEGLIIIEGVSESGRVLQSTFDEELQNLKNLMAGPVVPVGIRAPVNWYADLSTAKTVSWGNAGEKFRLLPGQSLDGFEITSRGLPGLRSVTVEAQFFLPPVQGSVGDEDFAIEREVRRKLMLVRTTIGPTAPPAVFVPLDFLKTIQGYKEEAVKQGWITNAGVANSLDVKLNAAQRALTRGETTTAKNTLHALLNEVDAQTGKKLAPEAVALLKFNTEFLLSRL